MKKKINTYLLLTTFLTLAATLLFAVAIFHNMYREQIIEDMRTYAGVLGSMAASGEEFRERYAPESLTRSAEPAETPGSEGGGEAVADAEPAETLGSERAGDVGSAETPGSEGAGKVGADAEPAETHGSERAGKVGADAEPAETPGVRPRVTVIGADGAVIYDTQTDGGALENHAGRPEIAEAREKGEGYSVRHSDTLDSDMYYYAVRLENGDVLRVSKEEDSIWSVFRGTIWGIVAIAVLMFLVCMLLARYITAEIVRPVERLAADIGHAEEIDAYEELAPFLATIRRQHADIIRSAQMRQEFTANVSHELKTPLTSISGYAELIETGLAGEHEIPRFAGEIRHSADRLLTLINDIIRLSELDGGRPEVAFEEVDLHEVAENCVETLQVGAGKHGVRIQCHGHRCLIRANREMMEELLFNLCENAIRYNRPGGRVDVRVEAHGDQVALTVKDTGIGIPKESQERVFERFYRVDKSRSKSTGGTGLGLAIVKHIVELHQAELRLCSEEGKGTEVTVLFC